MRQAPFGVYVGDGEFLLRRYKFGDVFIFTEDHWDKDTGSVKPLKKLERTPEWVYENGTYATGMYNEDRLLAWLDEQARRNPIEET